LSSPSDPNGCTGLSWIYDAWGNRTDQTVTGGTCPSFHQTINTQNRLANSPYAYDAAGNLTADGSHTYFYDAENRLVQVGGTFGTCSTATACYTYDALGRRVEKVVGSVKTDYLYDLSGNVVTEWCTNCSGGLAGWSKGYAYFNGSLAAEYANSTTYFAHRDHLGSARLLTGVNQSVVQNLDYLPFGELNSSDSGITTHKFTGDEQDAETALAHTLFRQYSSSIGRWMTPDPAGLAAVDPTSPQSWNRYAYVLNNPLSAVDPLGLQCVWDDGSFDSADDPNTGSYAQCQAAGGTYFDPNTFQAPGGADWSPNPTDLASRTADALGSLTPDAMVAVSSDPFSSGPSPSWAAVKGFFTVPSTGDGSCLAVLQEAASEPVLTVYHATEGALEVGATFVATSIGANSFADSLSDMKRANPMFGGQLDPFLGPKVIAGARILASVTSRVGLFAEHAVLTYALPVTAIALEASALYGVIQEGRAAWKGTCH
jgi:RHS repeat-associated protein